MYGWCPFAIHKPIPPGANDPAIKPRAVILHVAVSLLGSLFSYFRYRSGGIESHFYITLTGKIEQYRSIYYEADANYRANPFAVSIETAGMGSGKWNRRQMAAIKKLLLWLKSEGIPLKKITDPYGSGVGYHTQFGAPSAWTPVAKSCPGPERIKQYHDVLVPWMRDAEEEEMALSDEDIDRIVKAIYNYRIEGLLGPWGLPVRTRRSRTVRAMLQAMYNQLVPKVKK